MLENGSYESFKEVYNFLQRCQYALKDRTLDVRFNDTDLVGVSYDELVNIISNHIDNETILKGGIMLYTNKSPSPRPRLKDFVQEDEFPTVTDVTKWTKALNDWNENTEDKDWWADPSEILFRVIKTHYDPEDFQNLFMHYIISKAVANKSKPADVIALMEKAFRE